MKTKRQNNNIKSLYYYFVFLFSSNMAITLYTNIYKLYINIYKYI